MKYFIKILLLQIICHNFYCVTAQWCKRYQVVNKTRVQWHKGERMVTRRKLFNVIRYSNVPYRYSTVENYHDYERVNVCCDGYTKISDSKCEPICSPSCPTNTHCIRPNICECDVNYKGYTASATTIQCEPICIPNCPKNAQCIAPNQCRCNSGYQMDSVSGECFPICNNCPENSICTQPDQCTCNAGYLDNGLGECKPICIKPCPEFSECTKPEKCTCQQNYKKNVNGKCEAICEQECPENSLCIKPNECSCQKGYEEAEYINATRFKCLPKCNNGCPLNALCIKPNVCECQKGYRMSPDNVCQPVCENECPQYATCSEPNRCSCHEGYEQQELQCQPICEKACPEHASCREPNKCQCEAGYQMTEENICQPVCEDKCPQYATCIEPNKCSCNKGYELLEQQCQPVCEKSCPEHASCSEPNKCQCEAGYQLKLSSIYNLFCEPICQANCSTFGKCVQPNKCECLEGYEMDELEVCQPICSRGCKNGLCFQPEICICNPGYLMGPQEECEPFCSLPCQNGSCIEPEICQCHEGYKLKNNSINICEPLCDPQCINGICVAPNVCICHENYEPTTTAIGLNHHNCQVVANITITTTTQPEFETSTYKQQSTAQMLTTLTTLDLTSTLNPDQLRQTSASNLVSADICNDRCHCWQEFDEYGPLITKQCVRLCVDDFDKPCLDLNRCKCDVAKNHLICQATDDSMELDDDPLFYRCNLERFKATTFKPLNDGVSSDMKSVQPEKMSSFPWWWPVIAAVLVVSSVIVGLLYVRFRKFEVVTTTLMLFYGCQGQYKNTGIKTRYPSPSSGNLILGNATEHNETNHYVYSQQPHFENPQPQYNTYDRYNGNFKPAEYYPGGAAVPTVTRPPVVLDATAEFINKTRSAMASGICYTEVPLLLGYILNVIVYFNFCWFLYFLQNITKTRTIRFCCSGYEGNISINDTVCKPVCRGGCGRGYCLKPDECSCEPGYMGKHCTQRCDHDHWGLECKNQCLCHNGAACDNKSGICHCTIGWTGEFCEQPCPMGTHGVMCRKACECDNKLCHPQTGACDNPLEPTIAPNATHVMIATLNSTIVNITHNLDRIAKNIVTIATSTTENINLALPPQILELTTVKTIPEVIVIKQEEPPHTPKIIVHQQGSGLLENLHGAAKTPEVIHVITNWPSGTQPHHNLTQEEKINLAGFGIHGGSQSKEETFKSTENHTADHENSVLTTLLVILLIIMVAIGIGFLYVYRRYHLQKAQVEAALAARNVSLVPGVNAPIVITPPPLPPHTNEQHLKEMGGSGLGGGGTLNKSFLKPLPDLPAFTQMVRNKIEGPDLYDSPSNTSSLTSQTPTPTPYAYARKESLYSMVTPKSRKGSMDSHLYDEIRYPTALHQQNHLNTSNMYPHHHQQQQQQHHQQHHHHQQQHHTQQQHPQHHQGSHHQHHHHHHHQQQQQQQHPSNHLTTPTTHHVSHLIIPPQNSKYLQVPQISHTSHKVAHI
ncbi:uncharacterized protein LOC111682922 [Lucilia cuprina]|uniref:uncharacterized protein LOC111682922 n=1 Tax=Lucilia cuprina TaxID=7375 RepID=UPI001F065FD3|nr:uncharacterized protein LOC111682922 [Lucilia cuprina]